MNFRPTFGRPSGDTLLEVWLNYVDMAVSITSLAEIILSRDELEPWNQRPGVELQVGTAFWRVCYGKPWQIYIERFTDYVLKTNIFHCYIKLPVGAVGTCYFILCFYEHIFFSWQPSKTVWMETEGWRPNMKFQQKNTSTFYLHSLRVVFLRLTLSTTQLCSGTTNPATDVQALAHRQAGASHSYDHHDDDDVVLAVSWFGIGGKSRKITRQKHTSIDINSMGIETTYGGIPGMITKHGQIWVQFNLPKTPMFSCQRWPVCFADSFIPRYSHSGICQFLDTKETWVTVTSHQHIHESCPQISLSKWLNLHLQLDKTN